MFREGYASKILADVYKIMNENKNAENETDEEKGENRTSQNGISEEKNEDNKTDV